MTVLIYQRPDESTRTLERPCRWIASTVEGGQRYEAASRSGASMALARTLVEAGVGGSMRYPSLHRLADRMISESATRPVRERRWQERPDFMARTGHVGGVSVADVPEAGPDLPALQSAFA